MGNSAALNIHTGHVTGNPNNKGSGEDPTEQWVTRKYVVKTVEELRDLVQDLAWMNRL